MAIDRKYIELVHAEIDGEISADDRALLEAFLADNPEARDYRDEIRETAGLLDSADMLEPPPGLVQSVMADIPQGVIQEQEPGRSLGEILGDFFGIAPVRYALSFAAGVVLTFAIVSSDQASRSAFDDLTSLVGTMGDPASTGVFTEQDVMQLTLNELAGSVNLNSSGSLMILDFDLASLQPVEIVANFNNRDIWFNGFAQLESSGTSVAAATGKVTVRMEGQRRYAVYLHNSGGTAATVDLSFYSDGTLLHQGVLSFRETE